ncbi:MAG: hypothetical protein WBX27_17135 [Specibacter sp.]
MDIELHIETLVLDAGVLEGLGLTVRDSAAVGRAVEHELARLLAAQDGSRPVGARLPNASLPRLTADPMKLPRGATPSGLGAGIAASVMGGLDHG